MFGGAVDILLRVVMAAAAGVGFSVIFRVPRAELVFCGLTAAVGWLFSELTLLYFPSATVGAALAATLTLTACSRVLSHMRKSPVTLYLVGGIIPLVPGAGIYYTMYESIINGNTLLALEEGIETLKIAGVIAFGIFIVMSLPKRLFDWRRTK